MQDWGPHQRATHHVDELCNGEPELHDDHVGGVGHRPRPAVVAGEEVLEETLLGVAAALVRQAGGCGDTGMGTGWGRAR